MSWTSFSSLRSGEFNAKQACSGIHLLMSRWQYSMQQKLLTSIALILILTSSAHSQTASGKEDALRLVTAQITDIDLNKKVLTVREVSDTSAPPSQTPSNTGSRRGGRGRRGGGGR